MDVNYLSQHFSKAPSSWTHKEIIVWLELLNMKEYQNEFEINKVDGLIIFDLEDKEIEEILCIKNSIHRKRLRNGINILKQFQREFDKKNKKSAGNKSNGDIEYDDNMPPLNTAQPAQGFSGQKNNFRQFNSQTAPRRDIENVFNFNALAHFDADRSYQVPRTYTWDPTIEEEKVSENVVLNDHTAFDNKKDRLKNNSMKPEKPFEQAAADPAEHDSSHSDPASMNIEDDEPNKQPGDQNDFKLVKRSFSAKDDYARSPKENIASPLSCHQGLEPMARIGDIENQLDRFSRLGQDLKPVTVQTHPAELIIQPVDGVQSNNFYCINENGGRIGRHSNNEIVILEESVSRHHSIIEFKENKFYLVDIGSTTGSFIRIETPLILEEGMILELGSNQFYVEKITPKDAENGELHLKVIEGMHVDKEFIIANSATIGRKGQFSPTTIALVDDLHLSNTHTKIFYMDSHFILEDLGSTNGSWLRMSPEGVRSRSFELNDGLVFKIGASSTFKVKRSNVSYMEMMQSPKNHDGSMNCAICYENDRDVVFIPCKHNVVCMKCSKNIKQCPVCRFKINDIIRIYKS